MALPSRVLGVLAGNDYVPEQVLAWAKSADVILAADGGADTLHRLGITPNATIGDLDSISQEARENQELLVADDDQETSDCDKLLALCKQMGHSAITLCGLEGDRLDHVIATVHSSLKAEADVHFALRTGIGKPMMGPSHTTFHSEKRVSLLPLLACKVTMTGVRWPLDHVELTPYGPTSISNQGLGEVHIHVHDGAALLVFETEGAPYWC